MALTPNDVLRISEPIEQMYSDCTSKLLINIAKHLKSGASGTMAYEAEKLAELGEFTKESMEIIAATNGTAPILVEWALNEGMEIELQEVEKVCQGAAAKGTIQSATSSWQASERVQGVLKNLVDQATDDCNIVNTVMLDSTRQRYLQAVQQVSGEEARILATYGAKDIAELESKLQLTQKVLNQETLSVAIGTEARTQAVRSAIDTLCKEGITGYIDAGGHKWSPEAYINMDIRTTVHNAAVQGQKARSADYDVQTFQISSHAGARPLCAPYQGKIYSWDGSSGVVEDLYGTKYTYVGIGETSYGQPAGIFGINCGHRPVTFVDGYSVPRFEPTQDEEENKKQYELSQKQRYLERQVRDEKTKALCYDAAGDKEAFKKSAQRIKEKTANYKAFCDANNLTQRPSNMQVYGYNKSMASKVNAVKVTPKKTAVTPSTKAIFASNGDPKLAAYLADAEKTVNGSPKVVKDIWDKYSGQLQEADYNIKKGAYYDPADGRVHFAGQTKAFEESSYQRKNTVFFHETGHNIDALASSDGRERFYSYEWQNDRFGKTIMKECEDTISGYYMKKNGYADAYEVVKGERSSWGGMDSFVKQGLRWNMPHGEYEALIKTLDDAGWDDKAVRPVVDKYLKKQVEAEYKSIIRSPSVIRDFCEDVKANYSIYEVTDASDIFQKYTVKYAGIDHPFGVGHSKDYFNRKAAVNTEAFAEMYSATVTQSDSLVGLKALLPKSYETFLEMAEGMA